MNDDNDPYIFKRKDFDTMAEGMSSVRAAAKFAKQSRKISERVGRLIDENMLDSTTYEQRVINQVEIDKLFAQQEALRRGESITATGGGVPATGGGVAYAAYRGCGGIVTGIIIIAILTVLYKTAF